MRRRDGEKASDAGWKIVMSTKIKSVYVLDAQKDEMTDDAVESLERRGELE